MKKSALDIIVPLLIIAISIMLTIVIAKWIWGTNLPEWLKVLLIAN